MFFAIFGLDVTCLLSQRSSHRTSKLLIGESDSDSAIVGELRKMAILLPSLFQESVSSDWLKFAVISNALFVI